MYAKDLFTPSQTEAHGDKADSYRFGPFVLDATERTLMRNGEPVALTPKAFETLLILVKRSGKLLTKAEMLDEVWPSTFVEEKTLAQNIFILRKILGHEDDQKYIETVPKHGYRFVADVQIVHPIGPIERLNTQSLSFESNDRMPARVERSAPTLALMGSESSAIIDSDDVQPSESAKPVSGATSGFNQRAKIAAALLILLVAAPAVYLISRLLRPSARLRPSFTTLKMKNLTTSGNALGAAISPDGKYVVYVKNSSGENSLWLHQVATASDIELRRPARANYAGLRFTPDSNYVYYTIYQGANIGNLYQMAVLGGTPKLLITDIDSPVTFSPDGRRIAFIRGLPTSGQSMNGVIVVAAADGSDQRQIAARTGGDYYAYPGPEWSPDGSMLACGAGTTKGPRAMSIIGIKLSDGSETPLTTREWWTVGRVSWLRDGSGLLFTAADYGSESLHQIWYLSYPGGETQPVTRDLSSYVGVNSTADSNSLVTTQFDDVSEMMVTPVDDTSRAETVPVLGGKFGSLAGVSWTPDGRVVFGSNEKGNTDIWIADIDGTNKKQLTVDEHADSNPVVSHDGRRIAFLSNRSGNYQIWVMDIDGANQRQLTRGPAVARPAWSPDGQWIVYTAYLPLQTIWRVASVGGAPAQLTNKYSFNVDVSPDGRLIGCYYWSDQERRFKVAAIPFDGGDPVKTFDTLVVTNGPAMPPNGRWSVDGHSLLYLQTSNQVSSLWSQPISGGAPQKLTDFESGVIGGFALSPDGKRLLYSRNRFSSDVILISDLIK